MECSTDFGKTLMSFNRISRAMNAKVNSKEYHELKKQMTENEISVLRHLQHVRSTSNYRNNKLNGTVTKRGKASTSNAEEADSAAKEETTDN
jgi:hypothetical protein